LTGRVKPLQEDGEGNGIHLWYTNHPVLERNTVTRFTDAIYLSFVNDAEVRANRLETNGRYGLHTMYCQASRLESNHFNRNAAGCAIMFSNHLDVRGNDFWRNRGPRTYGLLLRDCSDGEFTDNRMVDNTIAIFMDNSNRNRLHGNLLENNGWAILMYSSCAGNVVARNSFVNDDYSVSLDMRRSDNRFDDGRLGNYWSENAPYDLNGDGVSDVPFSPVTAFSFASKQYPDLSILAKSPAVSALSVAERVMPALRPSEVVDHFPLVAPIAVRGTGEPLARDRGGRAATGAALLYGLLAAAGLTGLARARSAT
jgi:nitrous oxidase accessory protein